MRVGIGDFRTLSNLGKKQKIEFKHILCNPLINRRSIQNGAIDGGPQKSKSDRIALALVLVVVTLGIIVIIFSADGTFAFFKNLDLWYCSSPSTTLPQTLNNSTDMRAAYDDQVFFDFDQNFTSLSFNVTAVQQNDSFGFGPAYLLDALSIEDYWYQVGISWDWAVNAGLSYFPGFSFNFEAWNPLGRPLPERYAVDYHSFPISINNGDTIQ